MPIDARRPRRLAPREAVEARVRARTGAARGRARDRRSTASAARSRPAPRSRAVLGPDERELRAAGAGDGRARSARRMAGWRRRRAGATRGEKTLVFVAHRETLEMLRTALSHRAQLATGVFHEDLPPARRDIEVARFREAGGPSLLVSTECGGEGRNFEFCRRLVLFDLPWNPSVVEQRIGRLDRIGRQHPGGDRLLPAAARHRRRRRAAVRGARPLSRAAGRPRAAARARSKARSRRSRSTPDASLSDARFDELRGRRAARRARASARPPISSCTAIRTAPRWRRRSSRACRPSSTR